MLKRLSAFGYGLLVLVGVYVAGPGPRPRPQVASLRGTGPAVFCLAHSTPVVAKWRGTMRLNLALTENNEVDDAQIRAAALNQFNYVRGYLFNDYKNKDHELALSHEPTVFKILSKRRLDYGMEAATPKPKEYVEGPPIAYVSRAMAVGKTSAHDPGLEVEYELELDGVRCDRKETGDLAPAIRVPLDPYLGYWAVPVSEHVLRKWNGKQARVTPCATSELADLPSPEYYWYFYDPNAEFANREGLYVSCASAQSPAAMTQSKLLVTRQMGAAGFALRSLKEFKKKRDLKVGLVFGYLDHATPYTPADTVITYLKAKDQMAIDTSQWDLTSRQFARTWEHLGQWIDFGPVRIEKGHQSLVVRARGPLRDSNKQIEIALYLGPSDLYGPAPVEHWDFSLNEILTSDIFVYAGHSGLGENLRMERMVREGRLRNDGREAPAAQLIAFISCYSYTYFDQGLFPQLSQPVGTQVKDLVLTGNASAEMDRLSLSLLKYTFDSVRRDRPVALKDYYAPRDFMITRSFTTPPQAN